MHKHKIIIVSKNEEFKFDKAEADNIASKHANIAFEYVANNSSPLGVVYNGFLDGFCSSNYDFIYFVHADVNVDFERLTLKIEEASLKYDIFGLCGCAKFNVSQSPLNWFCGSNPFPESRWGCVTHGELGNQTSFFSRHSPDVNDHEVACIDGLCIVFSKKAAVSGLRFDPSVGEFDFYDTDISMQAIIKYSMKLGVIVCQDLKHYSVGKSILTNRFLMNELKFRKKWSLPIPAGTRLEKLIKSNT